MFDVLLRIEKYWTEESEMILDTLWDEEPLKNMLLSMWKDEKCAVVAFWEALGELPFLEFEEVEL